MPVSGSFPNLSSRVPPPRPVHGASSETDAPSLEPPFIHLSKSLVDEPSSRFPKQDPHGKRGGASLCEGFHEGDLGGRLLYWGTRKICKMPCKWAALSIGALLGNLEGVHLPGLLREKNSISGFLSCTRIPLRFYVWGHLELW